MRHNSRMMKKRLVVGFACASLLFVLLMTRDYEFIQRLAPFLGTADDRGISCYEESTTIDGIQEFNVNREFERPVPGQNIFFHETSCFGTDGLVLNARQACAVESAARMNPTMTVYLLYASPGRFSNASKKLMRQLMTYNNVRIRRILMEDYVKNTPLADWYASGDKLKGSQWPTSHMSDILRYLTLWKFGGIYLDLDVVVTSNLENLINFAGAEDWEDVAAGVIGFGPTGLGRTVADACLRDLRTNFRGDVWGNNGPGVITRTLQKICATKYARDMTSSRCHGFTVYPPSAFYPIHYKKWKKYFVTADINSTMKLLDDALTIHVWNKLSRSQNVNVGSQVPYAIIAEKYCPRVYRNCGTTF